jgi:hypothetical protein
VALLASGAKPEHKAFAPVSELFELKHGTTTLKRTYGAVHIQGDLKEYYT